MDSALKFFPLFSCLLLFLPVAKTSSHHSGLVFSKCANQTHSASTESHSQILSSLFHELSLQSSSSKFFKATAGDDTIGVSGFFQCRGDLGGNECYDCVNSLPQVLNNTCKQAVAARVQLNGCYFHYETDGFELYGGDDMALKHELLHGTCSEKKAVDGGFVEVRDAAFVAMESEGMSINGFYEADYEYVQVMAQCEGDLWGCDCSECVGIAVEIAREDCGSSVSGKVYLDNCFLSYGYNSHGKPGNLYPGKIAFLFLI